MEIGFNLDKDKFYYRTCAHLVETAKNKNLKLDDLEFYKTSPVNRSCFDYDITFRYKNQLFAILINIYHNNSSLFSCFSESKERFIKFCQENNFIPCIFPMNMSFIAGLHDGYAPPIRFTPINKDGWNLIHAITNMPIIPTQWETDGTTQISKYEQYFYATKAAEEEIEKKYGAILERNDFLPENEPQIIYQNKRRNNASEWCCIRVVDKPIKDLTEEEKEVDNNSTMRLFRGGYNGMLFFVFFPNKSRTVQGYDYICDIKEILKS